MGQCEVQVKRSNDELFHSDSFLGEEFSDELQHYKYIKREKKNGKWVYYYDTKELDKYNRGEAVTSKKMNADGSKVENTTKYKKTDKLFDSQSIISSKTNSSERVTTIQYQGKLSRARAKAEKKIFDTFYSGKRKTQKVNSLKKKANKAKSKIKKMLGIH